MERPKRFRRLFATPILLLLAVLATAETIYCRQADGGTCVNVGDGSGSGQTCGGSTQGASVVATPTPTFPGGTVWEALGGSYAYAAPCPDGTGDPIGTVFLLGGPDWPTASQLAFDRLTNIGMTHGHTSWTTRDNFLDNGGCVEGEITRATNEGFHVNPFDCLPWCIDSRWHVRCIVHAQPSAYGYWASCTPHWDSGPPPDCSKHYVPVAYNGPENYGGSGYDAARDWLQDRLVDDLGNTDAGPVTFNNRARRSQCDGTIFSRADGKVNVIVLQ